jgi:hypothetical protein
MPAPADPARNAPALSYAAPGVRPRRRWMFYGTLSGLLFLLVVAVVAEMRARAVMREQAEAQRQMIRALQARDQRRILDEKLDALLRDGDDVAAPAGSDSEEDVQPASGVDSDQAAEDQTPPTVKPR